MSNKSASKFIMKHYNKLKFLPFIIIIFIIIIINTPFIKNYENCKEIENYQVMNFNKIVEKAFNDPSDHSQPTIIFKDKSKLSLSIKLYNRNNIIQEIQYNDSIIKKSESLFISIYRNGTLYKKVSFVFGKCE